MRCVRIIVGAGLIGATVVALAAWINFWSIKKWEQRYTEDFDKASPVLSIPAYKKLVPVNYPSAGFCLSGPVPSSKDFERLRADMHQLFGEERTKHVMNDVWVEPSR
jgi:hypothetical protein